MAWIESHQSLSRHRKTIRAVALLKVDRHKLLGHLHELWWWAVDNVPTNGSLAGLSREEIAEAAGWARKDAERFVDALIESGFVDDAGPELGLHDWYDYAGKLNDKRERNAERMRNARATNVRGTSGARAGATGEDRRGEDRTQHNTTEPNPTSSSSSPPGDGDGGDSRARGREAVAPPDELQAFHELLRGFDGYEPSAAFYGKVARKYGHLDLEEEALKMADWLRSNQGRGKTCSTRWVFAWLRKAAEDHAARPAAAARNGTAAPVGRDWDAELIGEAS